jgi:hypothetical protein
MNDFRPTAAPRLDSTPGISRSVAMTLLGHKTDIMFRKYIQTHDERLVEAANALAKHRASEMVNRFGKRNGTEYLAGQVPLLCDKRKAAATSITWRRKGPGGPTGLQNRLGG